MLLYLSNNTQPDITFAVSQVARYTASPKKSHAQAVKTIVRYLARTPEHGIIVKPDSTYTLWCWVDADMAGLHGRESDDNPDSACSRYGYVMTFGGVPLVWKSQIIKEICLSTLHAEYVGLANALCSMIPIRAMIMDMLDFLELPKDIKPEVHCSMFEDNQGAGQQLKYLITLKYNYVIRGSSADPLIFKSGHLIWHFGRVHVPLHSLLPWHVHYHWLSS